ncbi:glucose-1-phosphate thymidylyltransferase [Microbispora amethystogenes]|nr:glucose-1-phosphate thymidylyltransferase [Microbispora amethystogenes]
MKALVLSGGSGTRLRPFSHSMPKQLIPVAGEPVLAHALGAVARLGVTDVGVVIGGWEREIAEAIGDGSRFGVRVTYLRQERPDGLASCVALARPFLGDDDFVVYLGDNVLPDGIDGLAAEFRARRPAAHIAVQKVEDPRAFGIAELASDGSVVRLVEKPEPPCGDLAVIGVYFFTAAVHAAVAAIRPSARGELEITDALQWLLDQGARVTASEYAGYWKDTGRPEDVLACNRRLLGDLCREVRGDVDAASTLSGPVLVEPGARVVRSRIDGPAIIGAGAVVKDSHVGPHTSVGRDCLLNAAGVADSVLLDGATIAAVPDLRGCIVGRSATVTGGARRVHHRLMVGDHASVELPGVELPG